MIACGGQVRSAKDAADKPEPSLAGLAATRVWSVNGAMRGAGMSFERQMFAVAECVPRRQ